MPLYDKPVRQLMHDMVADLNVQKGQIIDRRQVGDWFQAKYPRVKIGTISAHLIRLSTNAKSRLHHTISIDGSDDLFFQLDGNRFRLYDANNDPTPIYVKETLTVDMVDRLEDGNPANSEEDSQFAYEHDLRDFLARNLHLIEPGLRLYSEEGIDGVEFPVGGRFIDILASDKNNNYAVIELKVSKGYDRVVGQLLRYMNWIELHHADPSQQVRGIIVAKEISDDLKLACRKLTDVHLFAYQLSVTISRVN